MTVENISQEFRLKNIDQRRNHFIEEINQNELMGKKHKKLCKVLNYISIPVGIASLGLKICVITAEIKKYNSINKKKEKKHNKVLLLAKFKSNSIEVLISKALIDSNITHDEFVSINHVLRRCDDMKNEIRNLKT